MRFTKSALCWSEQGRCPVLRVGHQGQSVSLCRRPSPERSFLLTSGLL